jgi:oligopeptide transport system ATP-binding protein
MTEQIRNGSANGEKDGRPLLEIKDLKKYFQVGRVDLKAVDGITLEIKEGETFGLVGESGCGKSTTGRVLVRLYEPTGGEVLFGGKNIHEAKGDEGKALNRKMQMVFQDPQASLNPRMVVGDIVAEGIDIHGLAEDRKERLDRVHELLETVGLSKEHANRYPHEFSGGQRQRIGVARAIALNPRLIICDEPVSALDVSIQAQVINLLEDLQQEFDLTYVFIAHDLSVVKHISDRVAVMYLGKIVEIADRPTLYGKPRHPYTASLLSAIPIPDPQKERERQRVVITGDVPSPANPPSGCNFHNRCPRTQDYCTEHEPGLEEQEKVDHRAACFFPVLEGQRIEEPETSTPYRAE